MKELADLVGTSQQQIDRLEKGQRKITAEWMAKLCGPLECKPADLLVFDNDAEHKPKTLQTVVAKVIGAIETKFSNSVRKFESDEEYEISFRPAKKDFGKKFFALIVEGGAFKNYPENSELIFAAGKSVEIAESMHEDEDVFISAAKPGAYKFEIGDKLVEGILVKSIRSE